MSTLRKASVLLFLFACGTARADGPGPAAPLPTALQGVDVIEDLNAQVPLDLKFVDQNGKPVRLKEYFHHDRPVVLTLVYYECPMLCSLVLNGLVNGLQKTPWKPGRDFDLLTVSFDPSEKPPLAADKRSRYLKSYGQPEGTPVWPFLTGEQEPIRMLADAVGFRYNALPGIRQFAHSAVVFVLTPEGRVSRYLYGIEFSPRDLRLALAEAAAGRAGPTFDRVLLSCFRYNPATRQYAVFVTRFLQIGGLFVLCLVVALLVWCWRLELRGREAMRRPVARGRVS